MCPLRKSIHKKIIFNENPIFSVRILLLLTTEMPGYNSRLTPKHEIGHINPDFLQINAYSSNTIRFSGKFLVS
jgi:hypothetical protein